MRMLLVLAPILYLSPGCHAQGLPSDSAPPGRETGTPDSGTPDSDTPDTGTGETGSPDTGPPDTGTPEYWQALSIQSSQALTDFQVQLITGTSSAVAQGHMLDDCSDVRFFDSDGVTVLPHWIESGCDTSTTVFWVKVPDIAVGNTTIWLTYGLPDSLPADDPSLVFELFDGFTDPSLAGWTLVENRGTASVRGGALELECPDDCDWWSFANDGVRVFREMPGDLVYEAKFENMPEPYHWAGLLVSGAPWDNGPTNTYVAEGTGDDLCWEYIATACPWEANHPTDAYHFRVRKNGRRHVWEYSIGPGSWQAVTENSQESSYVGLLLKNFHSDGSAISRIDHFFARKNSTPEPTVSLLPGFLP